MLYSAEQRTAEAVDVAMHCLAQSKIEGLDLNEHETRKHKPKSRGRFSRRWMISTAKSRAKRDVDDDVFVGFLVLRQMFNGVKSIHSDTNCFAAAAKVERDRVETR
jgi:hypothetical protein